MNIIDLVISQRRREREERARQERNRPYLRIPLYEEEPPESPTTNVRDHHVSYEV